MNLHQVKQWCRQGKYDEAAAWYRQEHHHQDRWQKWDYYYYAYVLNKTGEYLNAVQNAEKGLRQFPGFAPLRSVYCWAVYYAYIRSYTRRQPADDFYRAVRMIMTCSRQEPYSPYEPALWKAVQILQGRGDAARALLGRYLRALDPDKLSAEPRSYAVGNVTHYGPSRREQWYSLFSRMLVKEEKYEACIALCEEALRVFPELHDHNDLWFAYRIALCRLRLGYTDEGVQEFLRLLRFQRHWILYRGLFYGAREQGNVVQSLRYASAAMLCPGDMSHKVRFLEEFADFLVQQHFQQAGFCHYFMARMIRRQKGWQVPASLENKLAGFSKIRMDDEQVRDWLDSFWITRKHWGSEAKKGEIHRLLPGKNGGFIKAYGGEQYYFPRSELRGDDPELGMAVTFFADDDAEYAGRDKSKRAVDVRRCSTLF